MKMSGSSNAQNMKEKMISLRTKCCYQGTSKTKSLLVGHAGTVVRKRENKEDGDKMALKMGIENSLNIYGEAEVWVLKSMRRELCSTPIRLKGRLNYLEQHIPPDSVAPDGQQVAPEILAAHNAWIKGSKEIAGLMIMTIEPKIQQNLKPLHAHEMLRELKTLFAQQAEHELLQTTRDFYSCRQEEGQSVSWYVLKMKGYIDNLKRLGHPVTLGLGVSMILIGLRKEYDGFVQNYNMHNMGKTVNELHAMLKLHEQTLPKNNTP
nr:zinc finger, CCHC-type [Tanacetum cinerariifolium]